VKYPGITYLGSGRFSSLYGLNETIIDQKAIGLQHLFMDNYQVDLIHTACTVVTLNETAYFGDRIKPLIGHPSRLMSRASTVENHCLVRDVFVYEDFTKTDIAGAHQNHLFFHTTIINTSDTLQSFTLSALVINHNNLHTKIKRKNEVVFYQSAGHHFAVTAQNVDHIYASLDAPSGFMYHGIEDILHHKNELKDTLEASTPISMSLNKEVQLAPGESYDYVWAIVMGCSETELSDQLRDVHFGSGLNDIVEFWASWLNHSKLTSNYPDESKTMLIGLKAANLNGLLPADLTGHYFANGKVTFYVRDALMGSRAFLYAGYYEEFEQIINFLMACPIKANGEFYQRYNSDKKPDEGANNNVYSQIDTIGYFCRVISDYYELSGKLLVDYEAIKRSVNALKAISRKNNLFGPEGGVNEGVFGPAYITSTNMFIVGGVLGAIEIAKKLGYPQDSSAWQKLVDETIQGIENTYLEDGYYAYGYVSYHDEILYKYDTPQFLSASLGYPITDKFIKNYNCLVKTSSFFDFGMGYSEQEYHHGPWFFNTCAAAETAFMINDQQHYQKTMKWVIDHLNGYGMLPEAIDATDESRSFINPLMWANAEFVCAAYMNEIKKLRERP
jgi:GH15 family glucan-1,4-alpha-glucosidase